jgi:uncharacterized protein
MPIERLLVYNSIMQLSEDTPLTHFLVTAYQEDSISINHIAYTHAIIVSPTQVIAWPQTDDYSLLLQKDTELVLIGTGKIGKPLTAQQLAFFYERNIGIEVMNTQAACRTYNLLANEGRHVVAGLII